MKPENDAERMYLEQCAQNSIFAMNYVAFRRWYIDRLRPGDETEALEAFLAGIYHAKTADMPPAFVGCANSIAEFDKE